MKNIVLLIPFILVLASGMLLPNHASAQEPHPLFRWPLEVTTEFRGFEPYYITNYVDQDATAGIQDWNCGTRTYDGHNGIDIAIGPYSWNIMDEAVVNVVAAAPGWIRRRDDGNYDRRCAKNDLPANRITIEHADGSESWYLHLKNGSLTAKPEGAWVAEGEYLGKVGSSGNSTGPHLHFEVYDKDGNLIDPFKGSCNSKNTDSWWQEQKPYTEPAVIDMFTSLKAPEDFACPTASNLSKANHFNPTGGDIYFNIAVRNMTKNQSFQVKVYRPDGTLRWSPNPFKATNDDLLKTSYYYMSRMNEMSGTWRWEVTYNGKIYRRYFTMNCTDHYDITTNLSGPSGFIAGNYINASSTLTNTGNVLMEAGNVIRFLPNFRAQEGSTLIARIDACTFGGELTDDEDIESRSVHLEVEEVIAEPSLKASPNPFTDEITIRATLGKAAPASLVLVDISGRLIQNIDSQSLMDSGNLETNLSLANLAPGMYFLRMQYAEGVQTVKLVKQNRN